ncbi:AcvB/VirJ family lysyl-phosphatidylglycerol hydrolase [Pedobacter agri]|uniref:AcvB/VirJ family lysyl-phosphatidylglycerol hydrolase n=1 Tax=Pedobacter agri TaxID=454586 RepID=UPI002931B354|nr:AcvB/VirJ family lysyl-phosphatidylglycerol hydrolase [Pedobacter agri]
MKKISLYLFFLIGFYAIQVNGQDISKYPLSIKKKNSAKRMVFYLSGDGGMNSFSQSVVDALSEKNFAIVSLDSKKYFWDAKTPDKLAQDLNGIIAYYLKAWDKDEFSILGYSFGADAALFLVPRLAKDLQSKHQSTVVLSPSTSTDFVVKLTDLIGLGSKEAKYKTVPELAKINSPLTIIFGRDEDENIYKAFPERKNINKIQIPGSHKFNNDIQKVVSTIQSGL